MGAAIYNLNLEQGSAFEKLFSLRASNLVTPIRTADKHFRMTLRQSYTAPAALATASSADHTIKHLGTYELYNLIENVVWPNLVGGYRETDIMSDLILATNDGNFTVHIDAEVLAAITRRTGVWDLEMVPIALFDSKLLVDVGDGFPTDGVDTPTDVTFSLPPKATYTTAAIAYSGDAEFHAFADVQRGDIVQISNALDAANDGYFVVTRVYEGSPDTGDYIIQLAGQQGAASVDTTCRIELVARRAMANLNDYTTVDLDVDNGSGKATITAAAGRPWTMAIPMTPHNASSGPFLTGVRVHAPWQDEIVSGTFAVDVDGGGAVGHIDGGVGTTLFADFEVGDWITVILSELGNDGIYQIAAVEETGRYITIGGNGWLRGADNAADTAMCIYRGQPLFMVGDWVAIEGSRNGNNGFYEIDSATDTILTLTGILPGTDETVADYMVFNRVEEALTERLAGGRFTLSREATV